MTPPMSDAEKASESDANRPSTGDGDNDAASLPAADEHFPRNRPKTLLGEVLFLTVVCCAQLMTQAGLALSVVPMHIIGASFGVEDNPGKLSWFSAAYSLTVGTFILIAGRLGDVFGYKRFLVGGFAFYGLWSLIAGFSVYGGQILFDFCRAMQGIGPAFMLPNAIAIMSHAYEPGHRQNMAFSMFGATAPGGFILGAVFSSMLSQWVWWPWAYWVMCGACLLFAVAGYFVVPATQHFGRRDTTSSIWQRVDIPGSVTGVAALVVFNFAWNQGPVVGWTVPYTYVLLIVGILLFGLFYYVETRATHPLIPFGVLKIDSVFALGCIAAGWSSFGIFILYLWNFLEILRDQSPLFTTAQFSVVAVSGLCAALTTGVILSHIPASAVMLIAMTAFTVGGILFATLPVHQIYWSQTFVGLIILPWGMDMSFPAGTVLLSRAMPREHQGLAASLVNTVVNYSISIGLGIAGTVEYNVNNNGEDVLLGYRGAWYVGVGLAGMGVVISISYFVFDWFHRRKAST